MRWIKKYRNKDYKIVKRFAILPIRVGNEYRWFEICYVLKEKNHSWGEDLGWVNISWTNKETYEMWKKVVNIDASTKLAHTGWMEAFAN